MASLSRFCLALALALFASNCSAESYSETGLPVISRLGLAEFELHYPDPVGNPFADVAAEAVFSGPAGEAEVRLDGFYDGDSTWRFRFVPRQEGRWSARLSLEREGRQVASADKEFICRDDDPHRSHGFLARSQVNPYRLQYEDGTPYYAIGIQECGHEGGGLDGPRRGEGQWRTVPMEQYLDAFQGAANLFRIQLGTGTRGGCAREIMKYELGLYRYDLDVSRLLDHTFSLLVERGFSTMLIPFQDMSLWTTDTTIFGPVRTLTGWKDVHDSAMQAAIRHYLRYLVARYACWTDVWEFFNEDIYVPDDWLAEISAYVRQIDPYRHLHSNSYERPQAPWCDVLAPHLYLRVPAAATEAILTRELARLKSFGKPVVFTEFGNKGNLSNRDPDKWRVAVWTAFMNESAVVFWGMGGIETIPTEEGGGNSNAYLGPEARQYFRNFFAFAEGLPADLRPAMIGYPGGDGVARFALSNGQKTVIYLHHYAGYETATKAGIYVWSWPGRFEIKWYHPAAGEWTAGGEVESSGNVLLFESPDFNQDLAALITRVD